jgi:hypothetical protein
MMVLTGFIWLRIWTSGRLLWTQGLTSGSHRMWGMTNWATINFSRKTPLHGFSMSVTNRK